VRSDEGDKRERIVVGLGAGARRRRENNWRDKVEGDRGFRRRGEWGK